MTPAFRRNAPGFTEHLSSLLTQTITEHPLVCKFLPGRAQALIRFRGDDTQSTRVYVPLRNGNSLCILQRIGPHPDPEKAKDKVTTLEYLYAFRLGNDPTREPLVRYEYVPEEAANESYPYPKGHVHLSASVPEYDTLIAPARNPFHQIHFPTGRICLEDFIELLIVEFRVPTHGDRAEALKLLRGSKHVFLEQKKTKD